MKLNILVYGLIAIVIGGAAIFIARDLLSGPSVGDCVSLRTDSAELDFSEVRCPTKQAMFHLGAVGGECPPGDYVSTRSGSEKRCFVLDVGQGTCVEQRKYKNQGAPIDVRASSCTVTGAKKVSKVIDGTSDKALCESKELSLAYSQPARTICMVRA